MTDREWMDRNCRKYWNRISPDDIHCFYEKHLNLIENFASDCKIATGDMLDILEIEEHAFDVLSGETSRVTLKDSASSGNYVSCNGKICGKTFRIGLSTNPELIEDLGGNLTKSELEEVLCYLSHPFVNPFGYKIFAKIKLSEYPG